MGILYSEKIGFEGVLKVEEDKWYIRYYFSAFNWNTNGHVCWIWK